MKPPQARLCEQASEICDAVIMNLWQHVHKDTLVFLEYGKLRSWLWGVQAAEPGESNRRSTSPSRGWLGRRQCLRPEAGAWWRETSGWL